MEYVNIYNNRHELLGFTKERHSLEKGEYRLSSFIWIINDNDELLIQQRVKNAKTRPNMWGTTAGGVIKGESSLEGAIRELKEEIGLNIKTKELIYIGSYIRINDYVEIWFLKKNININDLILDKNEVQDIKWFKIEEFEKMIKNGTGIDSGYEIFKMYYHNIYNK